MKLVCIRGSFRDDQQRILTRRGEFEASIEVANAEESSLCLRKSLPLATSMSYLFTHLNCRTSKGAYAFNGSCEGATGHPRVHSLQACRSKGSGSSTWINEINRRLKACPNPPPRQVRYRLSYCLRRLFRKQAERLFLYQRCYVFLQCFIPMQRLQREDPFSIGIGALLVLLHLTIAPTGYRL